MRIMGSFCMLLPGNMPLKALREMRAKDTMALTAPLVQHVHLRKCLGTFGIPSLLCSIGKE